MKVREVMNRPVCSCSPEADLVEVAHRMGEYDCGILPVADSAGKVVGVLTDRDVCLGLARRNERASEVRARDVMTRKVFSCLEQDELKTAIAIMAERQVRRLPVLDGGGHLRGILAMDDLVARAEPGEAELSESVVVRALRDICGRRSLSAHVMVGVP